MLIVLLFSHAHYNPLLRLESLQSEKYHRYFYHRDIKTESRLLEFLKSLYNWVSAFCIFVFQIKLSLKNESSCYKLFTVCWGINFVELFPWIILLPTKIFSRCHANAVCVGEREFLSKKQFSFKAPMYYMWTYPRLMGNM